MLPICETPLTFKAIDETGSEIDLLITVVSAHSKSVSEHIKDQFNLKSRTSAIIFELDSKDIVNELAELELEIESATKRISNWDVIAICDDINKLELCSGNPFIRKQILHYSNQLSQFLDKCVLELLEYAKHELKLSEKQVDGATLRQHAESIRKQTGITPPELEYPDINPIINYVWEWFLELNSTRQSGMGVSGITYTEIKAWCELTGNQPSPYEIKIIKSLDRLFIEHYNKPSKEGK